MRTGKAGARAVRMATAVIAAALAGAPTGVSAQRAAPTVQVDADGTVQVPAMAVPVSPMLSPEAQRYVNEHLHAMQTPALLQQKNGVPLFLAPYIARQKQLYPTVMTERQIGGVHVYDYAPKQGIKPANRNRVLINLHGGGFMGCFPGCAELESMPIAALGGIRVVSVDYRQGPAHRFPAASEDVASVYRALLKRYPAASIGIYGCSAGGMLTGMATAWFQRHALPRPGAIGVFCAGLTSSTNGFGGDADYTTAAIGEARAAPEWPRAPSKPGSALPYFAGTDPADPLVSPAASESVLRAFPPTLILTATRGFELSSAVKTHAELTRLGVEADLHVWEGLFHGFFYNPDVPESRDAYAVILRFFDRHLKR
ncbi:alpha/beta hydrolase [Sphingomonas pokkalii]|uniref:Alpha/beta hydrolase n=1 Tax=Sphingomonas pokkalii TaxID=2175090 RepID=A0A2U0SGS2_9SPHN|nr:alpha/beta hydrolase fold domain-containing protein [Sphingomonas pokkalii]PVX30521.1 alpha/beta hydrolase [Sphingomonas pokkalii]